MIVMPGADCRTSHRQTPNMNDRFSHSDGPLVQLPGDPAPGIGRSTIAGVSPVHDPPAP